MKRQPKNSMCRAIGSRATLPSLAATVALGALLALPAAADNLHPPTGRGGVQVSPVITSLTTNGSSVTVGFDGLQAPYVVQVSSNTVDWNNAAMAALQHPNFSGSCTFTGAPAGAAFFRVMMLGSTNWAGKWNPGSLAISNVFVGAAKCNGCHGDKVTEWLGTAHAGAITSLIDTNTGNFTGHASDSCVPCHSVGKGQPGGYVNWATTPQLAGVQCENCHGSANSHVNISGRTYRPLNSLSSEICGGCHSGSRHGTYDEWAKSGHAQLVEEFSQSQLYTCGACHVGSARMSMLKNYEARQLGLTNYLDMPTPEEAGEFTASCAVCHDPHSDARKAQLRNPVWSTNYYGYYSSSTTVTSYSTNVFGQVTTNVAYKNDVFSAQYDPNVQICGQCHNGRGVRWDGLSMTWNAASNAMVLGTTPSFSRGPHHSPQYNILTGILQPGYLNRVTHPHTGTSSISGNTNQCVACHMPHYAVNASGSTNVLGHTFEMDVKGCALAGCHTSYTEAGLHQKIEELQLNETNAIARVVALLNQWALTKAPTILGTSKYGVNAWEYTTIGALAGATNAGPSSADQLKIPDVIKQARFNLYSVLNDGSMGVHNPSYATYLIAVANTNVATQFASANFAAKAVAGFAPFAASFTNLGTGITTYDWAFGDGGTSTSANPSYTYNSRGTYSVTFTANSTETLTRTDYIQVVNKPVVSITADKTTVAVGEPVTFTNTSSNIEDTGLWRVQFNLASSTTRMDTGYMPTYTYAYTNAGTYSVYLRATTPAGSVAITNVAYITVTNAP
jgi:PKD repeat protein